MAVILEKGNTDVGLRAGEFIQKNRQMALQQALAAQEAQRDIARMAIQREQALQQQRYQQDQALRENARAAADLQYRYDALGQNKTLAEMDRESRLGESAASRAQALRLAEMGELGADRRADRAERGDERREQSALEREKMAAERHTALLESNRRDALESLDINLREKREKEERDRAQKETDANMQARLKAEALGLGPIPEDASTEGIMRLAGVTQSNKEQIATAEKRYNDLQERLINYTSRIDNPTPDQSNVIRQLNDESKAAFAHLTELRQIVQSGGASPQRAPLPMPSRGVSQTPLNQPPPEGVVNNTLYSAAMKKRTPEFGERGAPALVALEDTIRPLRGIRGHFGRTESDMPFPTTAQDRQRTMAERDVLGTLQKKYARIADPSARARAVAIELDALRQGFNLAPGPSRY